MEFQNLQSLLNRATAPASEEEAKHYCTRFTTLVNQEPDGASRAITLLIGKVQSPNEPIALRAIHVMDQCSKLCGKPFQSQIGKFRFLNELIKLVSPKYAGNQTAIAVRSAIVQQLKIWSLAFKDHPKIIEAYKMLEKTGNTTIQTTTHEFSYAAGEDAAKAALLAQLLKSKNKQDLESANRMIKDMVAAEGRKVEQDGELLKDVSLIHNNGRLLDEMLANLDRSEEDLVLLEELHKTCVGLRPKLYRLAGQLSDSAQLSSVVEAGETLNKAIENYEMQRGGAVISAGTGAPPQISGYLPPSIGKALSTKAQPPPPESAAYVESTTLINLEEEVVGEPALPATNTTMSADDFDDFLSSVTAGKPSPAPVSTPNISTALSPSIPNGLVSTASTGLFGGMTLQQPADAQLPSLQPVAPAPAPSNTDFSDALGLFSMGDPPKATAPTSAPASHSLLEDFFSTPSQPTLPTQSNSDMDLMSAGLPVGLFSSEPSSGELDLLQPTSVLQPTSNTIPAVADPVSTGDKFDMLMPGISGASFTASPKHKPTLSELSTNKAPTRTLNSGLDLTAAPVTPPRDALADVEVPLTLIKPSAVPPLLVFDNGVLRVNLYRTENKPQPDITVMLATITNSSTVRIEDVCLGMTVPGGCKLKLGPASSTSLSAFSPICPASPVQQVLLVTGNPGSLNYTLTFNYNSSVDTKSGTVNLS